MGNRVVFPPSGICHSQQFSHSPLYWFTIITPTFQPDSGVGPTVRDGEGTSTQVSRQEAQALPTCKMTRLDTRHNKHWPVAGKRTGWCACSAKNNATRLEFRRPENNVGLCAGTSLKVYHTKLHFYGPTDTKLEKWSTQTKVHVTLSLWNWYISGAFSW